MYCMWGWMSIRCRSVDVAIAETGPAGEVRFYGRIGGDLEALDKVTRKLQAQGAELYGTAQSLIMLI